MKSLFLDSSSSLPPWMQIKEQIKVAFAFGSLKQGDVLPSIRSLSGQLGVGEAAVRRAYADLQALGFLSGERRRHVRVNHDLMRPPHIEALLREMADGCDRLIDLAQRKKVSSIAVARLALRRAMARETARPSFIYVDASARAAQRVAERISRAWEIPIAPVPLEEVHRMSGRDLRRLTGILVNFYRCEKLLSLIRRREGIFPVRVRLNARHVRRMQRMPRGSSILLVFPDDDFQKIGRIVVENHYETVGRKWHFEAAAFRQAGELSKLAKKGRYRLIVVSDHIWDRIPKEARRLPNVIPNQNEPDMKSLEEIRVQAGVVV